MSECKKNNPGPWKIWLLGRCQVPGRKKQRFLMLALNTETFISPGKEI
jgi:hypothetical protein